MSHLEALRFFQLVESANRPALNGVQICEIGSCDVNGGIRSIFSRFKSYVGVDVVPGPGVDEVCKGHLYPALNSSFDLVLSSECLEHDPYWRLTVENMIRLVRPGGIIAISCASTGRVEHGTKRTRASDSPGSHTLGDHYKNIDPSDFLGVIKDSAAFSTTVFDYNKYSCDIYFAGLKAGCNQTDETLSLPKEVHVKTIARDTALMTHFKRLPNYALRKIPLSEGNYQTLSIKVGNLLDRIRFF